MNITVKQEHLKAGLQVVGQAASSRPAIPVLANVLLEANGAAELKLSATNLQLGITGRIPAVVETAGATTLPAGTLGDLVASLPAGDLSLALNPKTEALTVRAGQSEAKIKGIVAGEFPPSITGRDAQTIRLPTEQLKELIRCTAFSAGQDESRPVLTGVLFDLQDGRLTLSSADGFRLSVAGTHLPDPPVSKWQAIVPASSLKELLAAAPDQGDLELRLEPERITFRLEGLPGPLLGIELVTLLIDGKFPDFTDVIPKDPTVRVSVDRPALLQACRQARIFARESSDLGIFRITPGREREAGQLLVSGHSKETGSNSAALAAAVEGEELEIGFNLRYLVEALQVFRKPNVILGLTTPESPAAPRAVGDEDFTHVLMPMHL